MYKLEEEKRLLTRIVRGEIGTLEWDLGYFCAQLLKHNHDLNDEIKYLETNLKLNSHQKEKSLTRIYELHKAKGNTKQIMVTLIKIAFVNPNNTNAMLQIAELYEETLESSKAIKWYKRILHRQPSNIGIIKKLVHNLKGQRGMMKLQNNEFNFKVYSVCFNNNPL